jgi:cyclase
MLRPRVIPSLLIQSRSLVKTIQFGKFDYIGDPCNTMRIFNELEVDELMVLDISATSTGSGPDFELLQDIADQCFMPLAYGGGIRTVDDARRILASGFEKIVLNTGAVECEGLVHDLSSQFGSQSVIAAIDVKQVRGQYRCCVRSGTHEFGVDPVTMAKKLADDGAGELLLTSIDREGTWSGFDLELVRLVSSEVGIPVVAHGGCGTVQDLEAVIHSAGASAAAVGSMFVYQSKGFGVLVNFPIPKDLKVVHEGKDPAV